MSSVRRGGRSSASYEEADKDNKNRKDEHAEGRAADGTNASDLRLGSGGEVGKKAGESHAGAHTSR